MILNYSSQDILTVSTKLESMDRRIEEKTKEISATPEDEQGRLKEELRSLQQGRDKLRKQKAVLDSKLQDGATLTPQEQRRLEFLSNCKFRLPNFHNCEKCSHHIVRSR